MHHTSVPLMVTRPRPVDGRGLSLPELLAMTVVAAAIVGLAVASTRFGATASQDFEAAAALDSVLSNATSLWVQDGELSDGLVTPSGPPGPLQRAIPGLYLVPGSLPLTGAEAGDTVSVDIVAGRSGAIAAAARSSSGSCLLTRVELGDGAGPQRFAMAEPDANTVCAGMSAMNLGGAIDPGRDGSSWSSPMRLP